MSSKLIFSRTISMQCEFLPFIWKTTKLSVMNNHLDYFSNINYLVITKNSLFSSSPEQRTEHPVGYKRRRRCSAETTSCHQTNSCRGQLGNGAVLKENQQMLIEGQASTGRTRGRKAVARPGRGRGKMRWLVFQLNQSFALVLLTHVKVVKWI